MAAVFQIAGLLPILASVELAYWLAWGGSLALSVTLVILLWTRWGHSRPLHKCAVLSLLVHLILAFLTMTVRIVTGDGSQAGGGGGPIRVRILQDGGAPPMQLVETTPAVGPTESPTEVEPPPLLELPPTKENPAPTAAAESPPVKSEESPQNVEQPVAEPPAAMVETKAVEVPPLVEGAPSITVNEKTATPKPVPQITAAQTTENPTNAAASTVATSSPLPQPAAALAPTAAQPSAATASSAYSLRSAPGRLDLVEEQGGNANTEAAVVAALGWLAAAQSRDGRWDAVQFGAGQEEMVLGQNRGGAGRNADTGITALALLAYLGAGHTHLQGDYQDTVRRGLDFLLRSQAPDGSLFGEATLYAQMYCHSMAAFALAEAQAVSGDRRLQPAVTKAVNYCLAAQNGSTGGWRYRPGDIGDTSQLGWHVMALASAERAGINVPDQTWSRVDRFLRSVSRGNAGGLASYRPDSPASTSMTAEALYCRLVLEEMNRVNLAEPAASEATDQLLATPPSGERINLYYWYYATLALHHRQHSADSAAAAWRTWNNAMTDVLINTQVSAGKDAGSWNTNTMWGGYGGRVYTTAMAAMCLEVYYRYAPAANSRVPWTATRPEIQSTTR